MFWINQPFIKTVWVPEHSRSFSRYFDYWRQTKKTFLWWIILTASKHIQISLLCSSNREVPFQWIGCDVNGVSTCIQMWVPIDTSKMEKIWCGTTQMSSQWAKHEVFYSNTYYKTLIKCPLRCPSKWENNKVLKQWRVHWDAMLYGRLSKSWYQQMTDFFLAFQALPLRKVGKTPMDLSIFSEDTKTLNSEPHRQLLIYS